MQQSVTLENLQSTQKAPELERQFDDINKIAGSSQAQTLIEKLTATDDPNLVLNLNQLETKPMSSDLSD